MAGAFNLLPFGVNPFTLVPDVIVIRFELLRTVNEAGRYGWALTQSKAWTPFRTGKLMRGIKWSGARIFHGGDVVAGTLGIDLSDVIYARRQEFEHRRLRLFLLRAANRANVRLERILQSNTRRLMSGRFLSSVTLQSP